MHPRPSRCWMRNLKFPSENGLPRVNWGTSTINPNKFRAPGQWTTFHMATPADQWPQKQIEFSSRPKISSHRRPLTPPRSFMSSGFFPIVLITALVWLPSSRASPEKSLIFISVNQTVLVEMCIVVESRRRTREKFKLEKYSFFNGSEQSHEKTFSLQKNCWWWLRPFNTTVLSFAMWCLGWKAWTGARVCVGFVVARSSRRRVLNNVF